MRIDLLLLQRQGGFLQVVGYEWHRLCSLIYFSPFFRVITSYIWIRLHSRLLSVLVFSCLVLILLLFSSIQSGLSYICRRVGTVLDGTGLGKICTMPNSSC